MFLESLKNRVQKVTRSAMKEKRKAIEIALHFITGESIKLVDHGCGFNTSYI